MQVQNMLPAGLNKLVNKAKNVKLINIPDIAFTKREQETNVLNPVISTINEGD